MADSTILWLTSWTPTSDDLIPFYDNADGVTKKSAISALPVTLLYFTEWKNTTAPNATIPYESLSATGAETNIDVALVPKGTGGISLAVSDNTATWGNKRGTNSIDLQTVRWANSQVASWTTSIVVGTSNTASWTTSTAIGGSNSATSPSTTAIGVSNTASASSATALGTSNTASGSWATAIGNSNIASTTGASALWFTNTASWNYSVALWNTNTAQSYGEVVVGNFATVWAGTAWSIVSTDRLFVVWNGTSAGAKADAVTVLKNGNTTISGTLSASNLSWTNTGDQTITLTGAVTWSGTWSIATTIATPWTNTVSSTNSTATAHTHAITSSNNPWASASLLATDASWHIGVTGNRIVKGWFTDLQVTNAIAGSVTGNAGTVTTNANLTGHVTSTGNATLLGSFTKAQLNTAISDGDAMYLDSTDTITAVKTFSSAPVFNALPTGTAVASASTASTLASRDANGNLSAVNLIEWFTTTATAGATTTLLVWSTYTQVFTGTLAQTVLLPTTSIVAGQSYVIVNNSTGLVTVQSSWANTILILASGTSAIFTAVVATPTTAANWNAQYIWDVVASGKKLNVSNSLTLVGTDATTMTFPSTSATIARTDAANTFTGVQTFSTPIATGSVATMTATVGGWVPTPPNNTTTFLRWDGTFATPTWWGTVTASGWSLTANSVVLWAWTTDTKVVAWVTTDGVSQINLWVNATTLGKVKMFGNTSGDVTIQASAVAGTATVQTLPATTGTLVNRVTTANGVSASNTDGALTVTLGAITPTTVNGNTFTTGSSTYTGTASQTYTMPTTSKTLAANDGSNLTLASQAIGDLAVASSTTAYSRLADVAVGQVLVSGGVGVAPAYSANPQVTTIELGNASDTTLARSAAWVVTIEWQRIATCATTTETSNATTTVAITAVKHTHTITALAVADAIAAPTSAITLTDDNTLIFRIKDNATARALTWNAIFRASSDLALPSTTIISKTLYVGFKYNVADTKWDLLAVLNNF